MEKIKWSEKLINEEVLPLIGEKMTLLNNILRRKANWIGYVLRKNFLSHDATEGKITEEKAVGRAMNLLIPVPRENQKFLSCRELNSGPLHARQ